MKRSVIRLVGVSSLVLGTVVLPLAGDGTAGAGTVTATSVLTAAKTAIAKQAGVHLMVSSRSSPTAVGEQVTADLGGKSGIETISEGSESVLIKVTPAYAYVSGNSSGLSKLIGLTSAEVKKVGKHWVSVKAGTAQYKNVDAGVNVSSVSSLLPAAKGTRLSSVTASASKLYTLKWDTAATSSTPELSNTLTLSAVGATLPVEETTTDSGGAKQTVALSKWGENVKVSAPPTRSTIPYTKITG